jgi:hypothetical protein
LSSAGDEGPVLCVVDDAQWVDRASMQTLTFVARRLLAERVGLVFATREPNTDLDEFPHLPVVGLGDDDARTLFNAVLRVPMDVRIRNRIVAETHGNPLALVEWPLGLTPTDLGGGYAMPARLLTPSRLNESFRRRVAELPAATQRFLAVAAAEPTGDPVIVWRAAATLGVSSDDAAPAIDSGVVEIGMRVWFRHPLMRSAVYGSAASEDRLAAHRALAEATDPEDDPDRRAWHQALGTRGPDEAIADALEQSARRARHAADLLPRLRYSSDRSR